MTNTNSGAHPKNTNTCKDSVPRNEDFEYYDLLPITIRNAISECPFLVECKEVYLLYMEFGRDITYTLACIRETIKEYLIQSDIDKLSGFYFI